MTNLENTLLLSMCLLLAQGCAVGQLGTGKVEAGKSVFAESSKRPPLEQQVSYRTMEASSDVAKPDPGQVTQVSFSQHDDSRQSRETDAVVPAMQQIPSESLGTLPSEFQNADSLSSANASVGSGLTREAVEQLALETSPSLAQLTARIESLRGKYVQSGLRPNPEFGYYGDFGHERTAGEQGVYWNREFVRGGKLELNREVVCREIQVAEQNLEIERLRVLTDVRTQFYQLLVAQKKLGIAREFETLSEKAVSVSQQLFEAEEIAEVALLQTKLQTQNINVVVLQSETEVAGAANRLAALIGLELDDVYVAGEVVPDSNRLEREQLLAELLIASPEVARAQAEYSQSHRNLDRQLAEQVPNILLQTNVRHSYGNNDELVQVQIGRPIQINNWNQGNIRSARADIVSTAESVHRVQRDLKQRFALVWQDYQNARVRMDQFENEIIPNAQRVYELTATGYSQGEIGYLDLITAQRLFFQANLDYTSALLDHWNAFTLIDGYLLSGSLQAN